MLVIGNLAEIYKIYVLYTYAYMYIYARSIDLQKSHEYQ